MNAGETWYPVYMEGVERNRMVLGGGCSSVGAAGGFLMGGGFSVMPTKAYGTKSQGPTFSTDLSYMKVITSSASKNIIKSPFDLITPKFLQ